MERFGADLIEQEFEGRVLAGESYGGEQYGTEPGVRFFGETFPQRFEGLSGVRAGDGQSCFGGGIVGIGEEAGDPRDGAWAFDAEDAAVAGSEDFGFFFWRLVWPSGF